MDICDVDGVDAVDVVDANWQLVCVVNGMRENMLIRLVVRVFVC